MGFVTGHRLHPANVLALHIKVPGHTGKNAITEGDSECILIHTSDNLKVLSCMEACRQKADMIRRVSGRYLKLKGRENEKGSESCHTETV